MSHTSESGETFSRDQFYNDWTRGIFEAAKFDSFDTEIKIARLLDTSPHVKWWMKLEQRDGAKIEYGIGSSYYPDFVACGTEGVHWIIEGKSEKGRDDQVVQDKRNAAVRVLREMEGLSEWESTRWGYLIAYTDDAKRAESWSDLRSWSSPEKMA